MITTEQLHTAALAAVLALPLGLGLGCEANPGSAPSGEDDVVGDDDAAGDDDDAAEFGALGGRITLPDGTPEAGGEGRRPVAAA